MPMTSREPPAQNRGLRVFVSLTVRDMMGEHDELMTHARHALRRLPTVPTAGGAVGGTRGGRGPDSPWRAP